MTDRRTGHRVHRDPAVVAAKRRRLTEPHVQPIHELCRRIAETHGSVPDVDPDLGGVEARALIILESPGPLANAATGSGLVSPFNDDPSAAHVHELLVDNDIDFADVCFWNVVPWWLPSTADSAGTFRAPRQAELRSGRRWLDELLSLMPRLKVAVAMGRTAQRGLSKGDPLPIPMLTCPHPAARSWNQPRFQQAMRDAFQALSRAVATGLVPPADSRDYWPD